MKGSPDNPVADAAAEPVGSLAPGNVAVADVIVRTDVAGAATEKLPSAPLAVRVRAGLLARRTWAIARRAARRLPVRQHAAHPPAPPIAPQGSTAARAPRSWLRRWGVAGLFVLIVVGTTISLVCVALSQERPTWWNSVNSKDPEIVAIAERLENAVATILTQARPPTDDGDPAKPWTVRIAAADVNAWLNARLPTWMESREDVKFEWPESLQELQVDFRDGMIHVGAKVSAARRVEPDTRTGNYFSAAVAPQFKADGSLWMPAKWVAMGRLTLPASWMLSEPDDVASADRVPDEIAELAETKQVLAAFAGRQAAMLNPTIKLGDGRKVKVLAMTAADGKLAITCQTILRESARVDSATSPLSTSRENPE